MKKRNNRIAAMEEEGLTKEQMIEHWMDIIAAVFSAEDKLRDEWTPKLKEAKEKPQEERVKVCDDYLRAIAQEILRGGWVLEGD